MPRTFTCNQCDKEFKPHHKDPKYCSRKCYEIARQEKAFHNQLYICKFCNAPFVPIRLSHQYCSRKCMFKDAEKRTEFVCEICGNKFIDRKILNRRFCSNKCRGKWQSESRTGENSPTWKGGHNPCYGPNWMGQSCKARKRDKYICQVCGLNQELPRLDVHHIVPLREFDGNWETANQLNNLITLCISCHNRVESGAVLCPQPSLS